MNSHIVNQSGFTGKRRPSSSRSAGRSVLRIAVSGAAALVLTQGAASAQPANDTCQGATPVVVGNNPITNRDALWESDGRGCPNGIAFATVFYRFTAPATAVYEASTCGVTWNSRLAVFTDCGTSEPLACNGDDPECGQASTISWGAQAGVTYIIRLGGESQTAQGDGVLTIASLGPTGPANNACANAIPITLTGALNPFTGSNIGATTDAPAGCSGGNDVWFSYTPEMNHTLDLAMCNGDFAPVLTIYRGECGALTQVGCSTTGNEGPCPTQGRPFIRIPVIGGEPYRIRVAGVNNAVGNFNLLPLLGLAANDDCADAIAIGVGSTHTSTTTGSTTDGHGSCGANGGGGGADVWYSVTPTSSQAVSFTVCTIDFSPMVTIYDGACGNLRELACGDNIPGAPCEGGRATLTACLNAGTRYLVRVAGITSSNDGDFTISSQQVTRVQPIDACTAGVPVARGANAFTTAGGCADGYAACAGTNTSPAKWFTYVAPCSASTTFSLCGSSFNTTLSLFQGDCSDMNRVACNDNSVAGSACGVSQQSALTFNTVAGTTYHLRVAGHNTAGGSGTLTIAYDVPSNDHCADARPVAVGQTYNGEITACVTRDGVASCDPADSTGRDVWYSFTPASNMAVGVTVCPTVATQLRVSAYVGTCASMTEIACNSGLTMPVCGPNTSARVEFAALAGTTYRIRVAGALDSNVFPFTLRMEQIPLVNPSFEFGTGGGSVPVGSTNVYGWVVTRGGVDWFAGWQDADGGRSVDLQGRNASGGMQQTIFTNPGQRYRLTFALAGNPDGGSVIKHMTARAGAVSDTFEFDTTGRTFQNMGWVDKSLVFVAAGAATEIEFYSTDAPSSWGAVIDHVRLAEEDEGCPADYNGDGPVNSQDFFDFLTDFFAGASSADVNDDNVINSQDFFDFVTTFFAGC